MKLDIIERVLKQDMRLMPGIRRPYMVRKLFEYLARTGVFLFNATTVSRDMEGVKSETLERYLEALEMSSLIYVSRPISVGSKKTLKEWEKIYITDTGIRNSAIWQNLRTPDDSEIGVLVETVIYKHLREYAKLGQDRLEIGYYRTTQYPQNEIDMVLANGFEKAIMEVKYKSSHFLSKKDGIIDILKEADPSVKAAYLVTKEWNDIGVMDAPGSVTLLRIPAHILCYLLGDTDVRFF